MNTRETYFATSSFLNCLKIPEFFPSVFGNPFLVFLLLSPMRIRDLCRYKQFRL
ncbi:hypothetical protein HMPREF1862_01741 [Varibaculum cambriense]|uniref:Uncharacterized protein n=1 Tax=Varibaculum cambriense TaxID=184870 RepID=A0AB34WX43_9ACTO|nr:hypothetical protein HMPREF1862_01741 [Varibaculum cambriense]